MVNAALATLLARALGDFRRVSDFGCCGEEKLLWWFFFFLSLHPCALLGEDALLCLCTGADICMLMLLAQLRAIVLATPKT